jgi:hypothetical protein
MNRRKFIRSGLLFVPFAPAIIRAQSWQLATLAAPASGKPNIAYHDFESGTIPSGWTTINGAPNYGYTPALLGSYSLEGAHATLDEALLTFPSTYPEVYGLFMFRVADLTYNSNMVKLRSSAGTDEYRFYIYTNGQCQVVDSAGTGSTKTVGTMSINTTYYVWTHYQAGSGTNALLSLGFSTSPSEPTGGDNFSSLATGASTANIGQGLFIGDQMTAIYDHVGFATFNMPTGW